MPDQLTEAAVTAALQAAGLPVTPAAASALSAYYTAVTDTNRQINLTAITAPEDFLRKHYLDSLLCYRQELFAAAETALDLGTGGGFPGIPLAALTPHICWTLLDATAKKLRFIEQTAGSVGLENVRVLHARAEEAAKEPAQRECYDIVTSRAVAQLAVLAEWALPFVRLGGTFIALKGPRGEEEWAAAERAVTLLGGRLRERLTLPLPGTDESRTIFYIEKVAPTPKAYPRKPGIAVKKPL